MASLRANGIHQLVGLFHLDFEHKIRSKNSTMNQSVIYDVITSPIDLASCGWRHHPLATMKSTNSLPNVGCHAIPRTRPSYIFANDIGLKRVPRRVFDGFHRMQNPHRRDTCLQTRLGTYDYKLGLTWSTACAIQGLWPGE